MQKADHDAAHLLDALSVQIAALTSLISFSKYVCIAESSPLLCFLMYMIKFKGIGLQRLSLTSEDGG